MFNRQAYKNGTTDYKDVCVAFFFLFLNEHTIAGEDDLKYMTQMFEVQQCNTPNLLKVESLLLDFWYLLSHSFPASLKLIKPIYLGVGTCFTLS